MAKLKNRNVSKLLDLNYIPGSASMLQVTLDRLHRLMDFEINTTLERQMNVKLGEWRVIYVLATEGTMTQKRLIERIVMEQSSASRIMQSMSADGWLAMVRNPEDLRQWQCSLTAAGEALFERVDPIMRQRRDHLDNCLSEEEKEHFFILIEKIASQTNNRLKTINQNQ